MIKSSDHWRNAWGRSYERDGQWIRMSRCNISWAALWRIGALDIYALFERRYRECAIAREIPLFLWCLTICAMSCLLSFFMSGVCVEEIPHLWSRSVSVITSDFLITALNWVLFFHLNHRCTSQAQLDIFCGFVLILFFLCYYTQSFNHCLARFASLFKLVISAIIYIFHFFTLFWPTTIFLQLFIIWWFINGIFLII